MNATDFGAHIKRLSPEAYLLFCTTDRPDFERAAEALIDAKVATMQAGRAQYRQLDERGLCLVLKDLLGVLVPCEAEPHSNGHVDLRLKHPDQPAWAYLVEAKIWRGAGWHRSGLDQLLGYATGRAGRAMVLAFFRDHKRMLFLLKRLREELREPNTHPRALEECAESPLGAHAFTSLHEHQTGAQLMVTHLGCDLWDAGEEDDGVAP